MYRSPVVLLLGLHNHLSSLPPSLLLSQHKVTREELIWFIFQKTKYIFKEGQFRPVEFPVDLSYGYYHSWKGYTDDMEVEAARQKYGKNRSARSKVPTKIYNE